MTEYTDISFGFSPRHQKYSGWLSLAISVLLLLLGSSFLLLPESVVNALLDYSQKHKTVYNNDVLKSAARMVGGICLAQAFSCIMLLNVNSLFSVSAERPNPSFVQSSRLAIGMQSITGLCWVIAGLLDGRLEEIGQDGYRRKTCGLLVVGFSILILSSLALMLSFWPLDSSHVPSASSRQPEDPDTEPLLNAGNTNESHLEAEAVYRLLEDGPAGSGDAPADDVSVGSEEETSRVRGTFRLLKLARPQVMYLYIGCATLLVRLPFSLSIPHFVSTTLGALSHGDFHRARREILWLFLLGTIDAFLDFWCIFWFGYANQRIVRGVRIDTFAAILRQEIGFFDRHTSGELASRLNSDCGEMAGGKFQAANRNADHCADIYTYFPIDRSYLVLPIQHRISCPNLGYHDIYAHS